MAQSVTLTPTATPLQLDPVWRSSPLVLTGSAVTGISTYRVQIWRRPQDARETDAEALATGYAAASSGTVSLALAGTLMDFELVADAGGYDDVWITLAGVQSDGQLVVLRAGWLRVQEAGCDPEAFVIPGIVVSIENDVATFTDEEGNSFTMPVYQVVSGSGLTGWSASISGDTLILTRDGISYAGPITPV